MEKYCVLFAASADNANSNNIIFTIKDTKLFVPAVTLSAKSIKNYKRILAKDLKGMSIKQKVRLKM